VVGAVSVAVLAELEDLQCSEMEQPEPSSFDGGRAAVRITNTKSFRLEPHPSFST
jgi:hypothetical protein